jgi:hypothetical protein
MVIPQSESTDQDADFSSTMSPSSALSVMLAEQERKKQKREELKRKREQYFNELEERVAAAKSGVRGQAEK